MITDDYFSKLTTFKGKGYVIAPAGYGKTHLIAESLNTTSERKLILTHTYAGVDSIRKKIAKLKVPSSLYTIETIASWSLKLCLSFPERSLWNIKKPENKEWNELYLKTSNLLSKLFIQKIIKCSYTTVLIDEYQDCSIIQHNLIMKLSDLLGCIIYGDPLQAIYDFKDECVNWERDIYPHFVKMGQLDIPWRWKLNKSYDLSLWLIKSRNHIQTHNNFDFLNDIPNCVKYIDTDLYDFSNKNRYKVFYDHLSHNDSSIVIFPGDMQSKNKAHKLAKNLSGRFSSIEEVEGNKIIDFIGKLQKSKNSKDKLLHTITFLSSMISGVKTVLTAASIRGEVCKITKRTKNKELAIFVNNYLNDPSSVNLRKIFVTIKDRSETSIFRRDLYNRFISILDISIHDNKCLEESAEEYYLVFRFMGRPIKHNKIISTTLLAKGLEYDHAIVVVDEFTCLKQLYVAITRGSKTLTIIKKSS